MADPYEGAAIVTPAAQSDPYEGAGYVKPPQQSRGLLTYWDNLVNDYQQRTHEAGQQLDQATQTPLNATDAPLQLGPAGVGMTPRGQQAVAGVGGLLWAPFGAIGDTFVGRPAAVVGNAVNDATGIAPGYEANPHYLTDLATGAFPLADEAAVARAAKQAGVSVEEYRRAAAMGEAARKSAAAAAKAQQAAKPPGPIARAVEPFTAAVSDSAAQAQAGQKLANAAENPQALRASVAQGPNELVPGSQPTTFQQTGDMGVGALERADRRDNPGVYQDRAADQNTARVDALPQPEGNPGDVGAALRSRLDQIQAQTDAEVNAAAANAAQKVGQLGTDVTPEESGAAIRQAIADAEKAGRARTSAMYSELGLDDPAVTANVNITRAAPDDIMAGQAATARPPEGEEAAIYAAGKAMKPVSPMRDLLALRSRIAAEIRRQRAPDGDPQAVRRLSQYQAAVDHNLDATIADRIEAEQAAAQVGEVQAGDSLTTRLSSAVDERVGRTEARAATGGGVSTPAASGQIADAGATGTALPSDHGPGGIAGNPSVPPEQPTVSPEVVPGLRAANAEYKAQRQTFGAEPVDNVLAQDKNGGYAVLNGDVPRNIFKPGPGSYERVQNAIAAGGDKAQQAIEDYAAQSLRRAAVSPDGTINAASHARWMAAHQDALRALPEATRARLTDVGEAAKALDEATVNRAAALKAENADALAKKLGEADPADIPRIIGGIFNKADSVTQLKGLIAKLKGDPQAIAGLRQAVADHIAQTYIGNTEAATSGQNLIKADAFQTFVRKNSGALRLVFNPEEMSNLHAIAADINRAKRSESALKLPGGSNTAQDTTHTIKGRAAAIGARSVLDMVGAFLGAHFGGGEVGAAAGVAVSELVQAFRAKGIARVDQLVSAALLDPNLARTLLAKVPEAKTWTAAHNAGVTSRVQAVKRALVASAVVNGLDQQSR